MLLDLKRMGTYIVGYSGGEPFMRKDFIDILKLTKRKGFKTFFITNAQLMSESDIEALVEMAIDKVTVSFHSIYKENYMKIFGIQNPELYDNALKNIKSMIRNKLLLGIAITLNDLNMNEIKDIVKFFKELGIEREKIQFNELKYGKKSIDEIQIDREDFDRNRSDITYNDVVINKTIMCIAGKTYCNIGPDGTVYPCDMLSINAGNIRDNSIKEIWDKSYALNLIRSIEDSKFEKCQKCKLKYKCGPCLTENINYGNSAFIPPEKYCDAKKGRTGIYD